MVHAHTSVHFFFNFTLISLRMLKCGRENTLSCLSTHCYFASIGHADLMWSIGHADIMWSIGHADIMWSIGHADIMWSIGRADIMWSIGHADIMWSIGHPDIMWSIGHADIMWSILSSVCCHSQHWLSVFFVVSFVHDILFVMSDLVPLLFHFQFLIILIISIIIIIIFNLFDDSVAGTVNTE